MCAHGFSESIAFEISNYHNSEAEIKLNLTDGLGFIGFENRCDLWFIRLILQIKKIP